MASLRASRACCGRRLTMLSVVVALGIVGLVAFLYQASTVFSTSRAASTLIQTMQRSLVHSSEDPFHSAEHHPDNMVNGDQVSRVRIFCWVMTHPENHKSRAALVQNTWGKRCDNVIFVSETKDDSLPVFAVSPELKGREHLTAKTMQAFEHVFQHHLNEADWFLKADDDTYVIIENLRYFLSSKNPSDPVYFGHHFKVIVEPQGYYSGGAGYVLSKEALRRFGGRDKTLCRSDNGPEDVQMGDCMQKLGVLTGDSRDSLGRSRFHCFDPGTHIHGNYPDWYLKYDAYGAKKGLDTLSDYAISFHYVSINLFYELEYYVYHLRPYVMLPSRQDSNPVIVKTNTSTTPSTPLPVSNSSLSTNSTSSYAPIV